MSRFSGMNEFYFYGTVNELFPMNGNWGKLRVKDKREGGPVSAVIHIPPDCFLPDDEIDNGQKVLVRGYIGDWSELIAIEIVPDDDDDKNDDGDEGVA